MQSLYLTSYLCKPEHAMREPMKKASKKALREKCPNTELFLVCIW